MSTAIDRSTRVLVVDDEENITFLLGSALRHFGFDVTTAATGRQGLEAVRSFEPDLVLLDVMLPDLDGFEVCRRMRQDGERVPVLFLTARDATEDRVRGLTLGGDDYVCKPFSLEEVVARIHAILRRHGRPTRTSQVTFADLELDDDAHTVRRAGDPIDLSPTEYKLLRFLLGNAGRVLSRAQILDHVWEYDFGGNTSVVDTYISYLRKKVDRFDPPLIHTVRGVGYSLRSLDGSRG
jgi:two-component system, OmpR family, response regulator